MSIRRTVASLSFAAAAVTALAAPFAVQAAYNPFNNQSDSSVSTKTRADVQAELQAWKQAHGNTHDLFIDPRGDASTAAPAAPAAGSRTVAVMGAQDAALATTPTGYPSLYRR